MSVNTPQQIAVLVIHTGVRKSRMPLPSVLILGFLAGAFIALGFLLDIRITALIPAEWESLATLLGAMVFPLGLILVVLAGGELLTGNMMYLSMALFSRQIGAAALLRNWFWVTLANFVGAFFVALAFGHFLGVIEGPILDKTLAIAHAKANAGFMHAFVSAIGCNWLVCLGIWLGLSSQQVAGKILAMWFPVMAFVAIGFQHVVANMFVLPMAILNGEMGWATYFANFVPVFLGNMIGGSVFVGLAYYLSLQPNIEPAQ
ncbi:formate/nitrite transporter family protein [Pseudomonas sp. PA27(2017)]|uniref:formate/nitrite transporter family protein n=1 Tax=Pseudomonas sp. PA27(2017) TaxID=1932112 RepID=UPI000969E6C4|nr:formate/nitrite transporter family protein [Pseudomonas sp. PA27(2017)]OLU33889.1 formate/nitrite transporter [Pseudomonas sp. PA27(2017)]